MLLLAILLITLNIYPLSMSRDLVFQSKQSSLSGKASVVASALTGLEYLTTDGVEQVLGMLEDLGVTRLVITDSEAKILYDTNSENVGKFALFSEVCSALEGNDVFHSTYKNGAFGSSYAQPVMFRNNIIGVVYAYELDTEQAQLLENLNSNFVNISVVITIVFLFVSVLFSRAVTGRLQDIIRFLRVVGGGDYNTKLVVKGQDELSELAMEFNMFTERLKDTEVARKRFVSDASHELKTPLASIKLLTDSILQTENIDIPMTREFVGDIGEEADRLTRITEKLLDITRLESASDKPLELVDIKSVIIRALHMLRPLADQRGVELQSTMDEGCFIRGNRDDIHQIVFNLLENALKYTNEGGFARVLLYCNEADIVLIVEDNGIGIPEEDMPRIFERFYRVDKARSREAGGTGLGLSIVNETVRRLGGQVTVAARNQGGTRFTVTFTGREEVQ